MGYELLHYSGDVEEGVSAGELLGHDEFGRPFAVIDAEYQPEVDTTTVFLQYATPEQISAAVADRRAEAEDNTEEYLKLRAAGLVR